MDKVILELVAIDRQAQQAVEAAKERSAAEREKLAREKDSLSAHYRKRAQQKADIIEKRVQEASRQELLRLEEQYRASLQELEQSFHEQEQRWVEEIVGRCQQP